MADQDDADKTEQPTPKRLREAREKGQVPRSRELSAAAVVAAAGLAMYWGVGGLGERALAWMRDALRFEIRIDGGAPDLDQAFAALFMSAMGVVLPVLGICLLVALLTPALIGGWNFSVKALAPDFSKLDPIKGLSKLFSRNGLMELVKALLKFSVVGAIAIFALGRFAGELLGLSSEPGMAGLAHGLELIGLALVWFSGGLMLIAAVDVPFQLWQHNEQQKMTRKEVRDEMKEAEGSPEVKARLRRLQEEAAQQRMMQDVPGADVVVTNPTHFAVALKYTEGRNRAPVVVAKGTDLIAAEIRGLAGSSRVPIVEVPMLARALYHNVRIGDEIPAVLYKAVALLLGHVMQLRLAPALGAAPSAPAIEVPEELTRPPSERGPDGQGN